VPELSYGELEIAEGAEASQQLFTMLLRGGLRKRLRFFLARRLSADGTRRPTSEQRMKV
jgi:hypothetical protein